MTERATQQETLYRFGGPKHLYCLLVGHEWHWFRDRGMCERCLAQAGEGWAKR